jgi:hypothetical protein
MLRKMTYVDLIVFNAREYIADETEKHKEKYTHHIRDITQCTKPQIMQNM